MSVDQIDKLYLMIKTLEKKIDKQSIMIQELREENKLIIDPPTPCRMSSQQELHSIVMEFLSDFEYGKISGYSPEELNLPADSLLASGYAKVSKTWCKLQKELIKNY